MTFTQLTKIINDSSLIKADWHQHPNGGGWVQNTASVADSAFVGKNAVVYENAQVYENARVSGNAQVYGNARVSGNAQVYGNARVYGDTFVYGDARAKSPLYIQGSKFALTNCKFGYLQIGCKSATYEWWLSPEGEKFGRENGFTDEELVEYKEYILLFQKLGK